MIRKFGQRAAVAIAATALAASGSALFGATAFAGGWHGGYAVGGPGGTAQAWCLLPISLGLGLLGNGSSNAAQCNAGSFGGGAGY